MKTLTTKKISKQKFVDTFLLLVYLTAVMLFFANFFSAVAFGSNRDSTCMKVKIEVFYKDYPVKDAIVYLYQKNSVIDKKVTNKKGKYTFSLSKNEEYTIDVSKTGCEKRLVSIQTYLPNDEEITDDLYTIEMRIDLWDEIASLKNEDVLEFPIAVFAYDKDSQDFEYNKKYTDSMKKEIQYTITSNRRERKNKINPDNIIMSEIKSMAENE